MAKLITIEIDLNNASQTIDLEGFHGVGCDAVLQAFAPSDEGQVIEKPEYNQVQRTYGHQR